MYVGIDLGGTNIAAGVVDDNGKILCQASLPTKADRGAEAIAKDMAELAKRVIADSGLTEKDIKAIGVGSPGSVVNSTGTIAYSNNINMKNFPLGDIIRSYVDLPVNLENDANAAAYGEYAINGKGSECFVFITLGTGVGGGVIIDGKLFRGFNGCGAELGHTVIEHGGEQCTCGRKGCWEAYASVTALIRQTKEAMEKNPESLMHALAEKEGKVSGRTAFDAAKQGDSAAQEVVDQYIRYVADGIVNMVNTFQPTKIVIGGGISKEGDYLLNPIREFVKANDYNKYLEKTEIEIATLFNDAGIIGAALAAKSEIE
ncbi:MAG: ROK family glucokinase [Clostridia bacterium]|nr:ROK family glucokinase [Clostridia bacterium]